MRTLALILALVVSTQAVAADANYTGRWGVDGKCDNTDLADEPWTVITLNRDHLYGYEYACTFTNVTNTGVLNQWSVKADCTNEGDSYKDAMTLDMTSNGLALFVDRPGKDTTVYSRCDETGYEISPR
ncbi:MAG: hypothetical protein EOO77_39150 [Oxalobacteraceae bacterium]|nr:MAG: hypothetical protein EOO77_39150 [Oxalobacteraceae bacterium]